MVRVPAGGKRVIGAEVIADVVALTAQIGCGYVSRAGNPPTISSAAGDEPSTAGDRAIGADSDSAATSAGNRAARAGGNASAATASDRSARAGGDASATTT